MFDELVGTRDIKELADAVRNIVKSNGGGLRVEPYKHSIVVDGWLPCDSCRDGKYTFWNSIEVGSEGDYNRFAEDLGMWKYKSLGGEKITYTPNLYRESLTENAENGLTELTRKETGALADEYVRLLEDNSIPAELYDYGDGFFSVEVDGDWKHDHLASEWILEQEFAPQHGIFILSVQSYTTEEDGSDWYKGVHKYYIAKLPNFNEALDGMGCYAKSVNGEKAKVQKEDLEQKQRFTNGQLSDFNPQNLMDKVADEGFSLHTIRENGDDVYFISIHYVEFAGPKGKLNPNEKYWVDVVKEDKDGNQERIFTKKGIATEIVDILNNWKKDTVG